MSFSWKDAEELKKKCQTELRSFGRISKGEMAARSRTKPSVQTNRLPKETPNLNEIEAGQFETDVVEAQNLGVRNYGQWADSHAFVDEDGVVVEPASANPDQLAEGTSPWQSVDDVRFTEGQVEQAKALMLEVSSILTDKQFKVYQLHTECGMSVTQIADELGITQPTVSKMWKSIEKRLKKRFGQLRANGGAL